MKEALAAFVIAAGLVVASLSGGAEAACKATRTGNEQIKDKSTGSNVYAGQEGSGGRIGVSNDANTSYGEVVINADGTVMFHGAYPGVGAGEYGVKKGSPRTGECP